MKEPDPKESITGLFSSVGAKSKTAKKPTEVQDETPKQVLQVVETPVIEAKT